MAATLSLACASAGRGSAARAAVAMTALRAVRRDGVMGAPRRCCDGGESSCKTRSSSSRPPTIRGTPLFQSLLAGARQPGCRFGIHWQKGQISCDLPAGRTPRIGGTLPGADGHVASAGRPVHRGLAAARRRPDDHHRPLRPVAAGRPLRRQGWRHCGRCCPNSASCTAACRWRWSGSSRCPTPALPSSSRCPRPRAGCCAAWCVRFSEADAQAIKDIEKTTNHDVKAVEYWLKARFEGQPNCRPRASSCTSPAPARTSTTPATR